MKTNHGPIPAPDMANLLPPPSPAYKLFYFTESPIYSPNSGPGWYWMDGWVTVPAEKKRNSK